jgi:hypothetical protein
VLTQFPKAALANLTPSHLSTLKFADILGADDISFIKDTHSLLPSDLILPGEGQIHKSMMVTQDNNSSSNKQQSSSMDDSSSAYSLINEENKQNTSGTVTSIISLENNEKIRA